MAELSQYELAALRWAQETIRATRALTDEERESLKAWMESGKKRLDWPYWEKLVGPRPQQPEKKPAELVSIEIVRKTA